MIDRIIDISNPASLRADRKLLVIQSGGGEARVPFEDIGALLVSHPAVNYTQAVLAGLAEAGGVFICCDEKHMPSGMLLPFSAHQTQTERFAAQSQMGAPKRKQLWRRIVQGKIRGQGKTLEHLHGRDFGLGALVKKVASGDKGNLESYAARLYWPALFADPDFRRSPSREDQNSFLNYGYAVVRGFTARAICGAGLHPSVGLFHHNRYDAFCLASDLMEPLRPVVDAAVARICLDKGGEYDLTPGVKQVLIGALLTKYRVGDEWRGLFDLATLMAKSLAGVVLGERGKMYVPDIDISAELENECCEQEREQERGKGRGKGRKKRREQNQEPA